MSSNINEVIKTVLTLLFIYLFIFLRKDFTRTKNHKNAPKSTKKHQKHKNISKQKHKNANEQTKIKNALKKHLRRKSPLFAYLRFSACEEKNRKVSTLEMLVSLN